MSTPKINFFIQASHGQNLTGPCPVRSGKRTIVRISSPGSSRARCSAGEQEEVRGRSEETPRCAPLPAPRSRTIVPDPPLGKSRSSKGDAAAPSSSCTPSVLRVQYPEQFFGISPIPASCSPKSDPDAPIIPNISRWRAQARPRKANQLFRWGFAICCYWDLFGFYGNFCWCDVFHAIFSTFHKFLQLFNDLIPRQAVDIFVGHMATSDH